MLNGIEHLITIFASFGVWGYIIVFVIALIESLALVGSFIPGATIVVAFGFLAAQGYFNVEILIFVAAIGAIFGDSISYFIGTKGTHLFKRENRILNISHLEKGKTFFATHGGKSILLGRFVGILRPIIPFVAGAARMNIRTFLFWNIVSGILWAIVHVLLGYFFGDIFYSIEVWTGRIGVFLVLFALSIFVVWFVIKRSAPFWRLITSVVRSVWITVRDNPDVRKFVHKHPLIISFVRARLHRGVFQGLPLTVMVALFVSVLYIFAGLVQDVIALDPIVAIDIRLAHLLYTFRDTGLVHFFLWITALGMFPIVLIVLIGVSAIFLLWRKKQYVFALWITVLGSQLFVFIGKLLVHRLRPGGLMPVYNEPSFSFPSGHAAVAIALYGFITYILLRHTHSFKRKTTILFGSTVIILLLGFSRLYLGVHFLSDVIGGYLSATLWLIAGITFVLWQEYGTNIVTTVTVRIKTLTILLIGALLLLYGIFAGFYIPQLLPTHTTVPTTIVNVPVEKIFSGANALPIFTTGIAAVKHVPINLIIIAPHRSVLIKAFEKSGWYKASEMTVNVLMRSAKAALLNQEYLTAPISPFFWNEQVNTVSFEEPTHTYTIRQRHHIRIWNTNLRTQNGEHIYVATASLDVGLKWFVVHRISPNIDAQRQYVVDSLEQAGVVTHKKNIAITKPTIGINIAGDRFFTDGEAYVLYLR